MSALRKRIQRNSFWKLLGDGSRLLLAAFFLYVARHYGPRSFGIFSLLYSAAIFIAILADLGLNLLTTRQVAAHKEEAGAYARVFFTLKLATLPLWLIAPIAYHALGFSDKGLLALFAFLTAAHAARNLLEFFGALFTGLEMIHLETLLKLSAHVAMLALGFAVIYKGLPIQWIGAAMLAGYLSSAVAGAILCQRRWGLFPLTFQSRGLAYLYRESLPLILIPIGLSILSKWDTLLLGFFGTSPEQIGLYSASEKVIAALGAIPALLAAASYPVFSDLHHNQQDAFSSACSRILKLSVLAGALCSATLVAASAPLLHLLYGGLYAAAQNSLRILALGLVFAFPNALLLNLLIASERSWDAARSALAACAVNVVLNLVFIPRAGISGAAASSVAAQGTLCLIAVLIAGPNRLRNTIPAGVAQSEFGLLG